jgi:nucleoid-associated protein YgaU
VATEAAAAECPVCGEGFREAPARCFRCETDLSLWWPLDESLRIMGRAPVAAPVVDEAAVRERARVLKRWKKRAKGWLMPILLLGGLVGVAWLSLESTRPRSDGPRSGLASPVPVPVQSPKPAPAATPMSLPRTVRYVVQPGDSLWRIAAALKGDARRWPELLGENGGVDPARLQPGQELRLVLEPAAKP